MLFKAMILGCVGTRFTAAEEAFFRLEKPWGLILFRRNIEEKAQILALCRRYRELVEREDAPVLIDQEGGRVQRLGPPLWRRYPAARSYLETAGGDLETAARWAGVGSRLIAQDLRECGITIDCMPVLDCPVAGADTAIGDRSYAEDPTSVLVIARSAAQGLLDGGVLPVLKHIPGHGRAFVDSHYGLPVVKAPALELEKTDFLPFRALNDFPVAMTAHIVFEAIDPLHPATTSKKIIREIIRGSIQFDGLLLSDDLSMKALSGSFEERTANLFEAGCDIALHCNGQMDEAEAVARYAPVLQGRSLERAEAALSRLNQPKSTFDPVEAGKILDRVLALQTG
jgi:beta-N-acetylhexosaminidase